MFLPPGPAAPLVRSTAASPSRTWERAPWRLEPVLAELAGYAVPRKVDCSGKVSVYGRNYYVSKLQEGKVVYVLLDPERGEWVFADEGGQQLRSQPAEALSRERIQSLTVCQSRTPALSLLLLLLGPTRSAPKSASQQR
jgi:hypothetical protein